jgi:CheY-like chemotaxis protein
LTVLLLFGSRIRYSNAQFERVTRYTLEEIRGENWFTRFLPERERENVLGVFDKLTGGGEITVESTPGAGSTFRLSLPAASASPTEPATASAGTVMYVDDNRINLMVVERMLGERSDINVVTAGSAEEFLETVPEARPDIVLLDINLPGADGFDALRRLREDPTTEGIPVVAVTASVFPEDIERYNAAGADPSHFSIACTMSSCAKGFAR